MAMSCKITEAGPDDPIYKSGWTFGGVSLTRSSKSGQEQSRGADSSSIPQEAIDQICQEITEAGTVASSSGRMEESNSSTGDGSPQQASDSQAVSPGAEGEEAAQDEGDTGQR